MEVLVSIALFVGAASFALAATRSVLRSTDRGRRTALAVDLARAKMAELELGLVTVAQLRDEGGVIEDVGSLEGPADEGPDPAWPWIVEVESSRSEFEGLSLVELTVREDPELVTIDENPVRYTLRQLVAFGAPPEREAPDDDLLDGLSREPAPGAAEEDPP
jgi:hypothetical protein